MALIYTDSSGKTHSAESRLSLPAAIGLGVLIGFVLSLGIAALLYFGPVVLLSKIEGVATTYPTLVGLTASGAVAGTVALLFVATNREKAGLEIQLLRIERDIREQRASAAANEVTAIADVLEELRSFNHEGAPTVAMGPDGPSGAPALTQSSVFGGRINHFAQEKTALARVLSEVLLTRAAALVSHGKQVVLVVDSGTTLFPLFAEIGRRLANESILGRGPSSNNWWAHNFRLVSNSISGIGSLVLHGRTSSEDRYSEIACNAELVAGNPLAVYSASVGPLATKHIRELRSATPRDVPSRATHAEYGRPVHVIAVTTGNYTMLRPDGTPVPLARGEGHPEFKEAVRDEADEVFVVGPLGNILSSQTL